MWASKLTPLSVHARQRMDFVEYARWAATFLMNRRAVPTAIFAANDDIACGLMRTFWCAIIRLPDDVSLAGFDDRELALQLDPLLRPFASDSRNWATLT
jgi:LacI family transcriptional regulator